MIVQGFWHGGLGTMERMCIESYVRNGHKFHLYLYGYDLPCYVPGMLEFRDAEEILPQSKLSLFPSPSIFSDFFRYALLMKNGGWWVDMDTICLRPFNFDGEYVFAQDNIDHYYVSGCFMKAPQNAPIMVEAYNWINDMTAEDRAKLGHMDIGPYLLQRLVPKYHLETHAQWPIVFDPIPWNKITGIVDPNQKFDLSMSWAIHLRQSIWNEGVNSSAGILPDGSKLMIDKKYPDGCLWEQLKKELL